MKGNAEMLEGSAERQEMKVAVVGRVKAGGSSCFSWEVWCKEQGRMLRGKKKRVTLI